MAATSVASSFRLHLLKGVYYRNSHRYKFVSLPKVGHVF